MLASACWGMEAPAGVWGAPRTLEVSHRGIPGPRAWLALHVILLWALSQLKLLSCFSESRNSLLFTEAGATETQSKPFGCKVLFGVAS